MRRRIVCKGNPSFGGAASVQRRAQGAPMTDAEQPQVPTPTLRVHFLKSSLFRVIHVDGAFTGNLPSGKGIHISLYSERGAIPQVMEYSVTDKGVLDEIGRIGKSGIVREIEVDAVMDLEVARALRGMLDRHLKSMDETEGRA